MLLPRHSQEVKSWQRACGGCDELLLLLENDEVCSDELIEGGVCPERAPFGNMSYSNDEGAYLAFLLDWVPSSAEVAENERLPCLSEGKGKGGPQPEVDFVLKEFCGERQTAQNNTSTEVRCLTGTSPLSFLPCAVPWVSEAYRAVRAWQASWAKAGVQQVLRGHNACLRRLRPQFCP